VPPTSVFDYPGAIPFMSSDEHHGNTELMEDQGKNTENTM